MTPKPAYEDLERKVKALEAELRKSKLNVDDTDHDISGRKQLERELSYMHDLMHYVIWQANSAIAIHDRDMKYIYVSENYLKQYKVKDKDVIGKNHYDVFPDLPQKWRDVHQRVLAGAVEGNDEDIFVRADGSVDWTRWTCRPWYESDGSIGGIIVDTEVITERKLAEEALRKSEEKWRTIIATCPDGIAISSMDGYTEEVSERVLKMFGYASAEELIGRRIFDFIDPSYQEKAIYLIGEMLNGNYAGVVECLAVKKDGTRFFIEVNTEILRNTQGESTNIIFIIRDVTERKHAEDALRESETKYRQLFNHAPAGIYEVDFTSGKFTQVNSVMCEYTGYSREELLDMSPLGVLAEESQRLFLERLEKIGKGEIVPENPEFCMKNKDGSTRWLQLNIKFIYKEGIIVGASVVAHDITDRKRAEEEQEKLQKQLTQAQKMESVGRLAGGVAHDFNNMLSVILGHTEMALNIVKPGQPLHNDLQEIRKAAERSADLTRQLLAFARKQTVAPKILNLNDTVAGMLKMLRRLIGEDIDLVWTPRAGLWSVKMDPSQIDQILANLCVNARDAIAGLGKVTIETGTTVFDEAYRANHAGFIPGDYVLLAVSDNGCGMDKETQSKLFEPFFTTKAVGEGTGLGLATVYGIVKQNNGFINVYSEPGHGTTIKIYLPRHMGKAEQIQTKGQASPAERGHETILLVEDERAILEMTTMMLERLGYRVLAASTPGEAIRLADEHAGELHMLMTDVVMPEMNGRDLARRLLSLYPDIKRLFMSGYTANVIAHHGVLEEGVHFIQKPFSMMNLATKLRETLDNA